MSKIVGIKFNPQGKVYDFDVGHFVLSVGNHVIVETEQGMAMGTVVTVPRSAGNRPDKPPLKKVYRLANREDFEQHRKNLEREQAAHDYCLECIAQLNLVMNLVSVESRFDGTKLTFYYTADGRVDFRELVKMLVKKYRVRIEMRHIGVRNRAKMCGGIGRCGHELCCCRFMNSFKPVSVKMAKEQGLSLNPGKISGLCGRLMCCLAFEHDTYCDIKSQLPNWGKFVQTKMGKGKVVRHNILNESVTVKLEEGQEINVALDDIVQEKQAKGRQRKKRRK